MGAACSCTTTVPAMSQPSISCPVVPIDTPDLDSPHTGVLRLLANAASDFEVRYRETPKSTADARVLFKQLESDLIVASHKLVGEDLARHTKFIRGAVRKAVGRCARRLGVVPEDAGIASDTEESCELMLTDDMDTDDTAKPPLAPRRRAPHPFGEVADHEEDPLALRPGRAMPPLGEAPLFQRSMIPTLMGGSPFNIDGSPMKRLRLGDSTPSSAMLRRRKARVLPSLGRLKKPAPAPSHRFVKAKVSTDVQMSDFDQQNEEIPHDVPRYYGEFEPIKVTPSPSAKDLALALTKPSSLPPLLSQPPSAQRPPSGGFATFALQSEAGSSGAQHQQKPPHGAPPVHGWTKKRPFQRPGAAFN